jgi:hypothetical protein
LVGLGTATDAPEAAKTPLLSTRLESYTSDPVGFVALLSPPEVILTITVALTEARFIHPHRRLSLDISLGGLDRRLNQLTELLPQAGDGARCHLDPKHLIQQLYNLLMTLMRLPTQKYHQPT